MANRSNTEAKRIVHISVPIAVMARVRAITEKQTYRTTDSAILNVAIELGLAKLESKDGK